MPHATLKLRPGVDQNETPVLNEAGISQSNLIRFIPDKNGVGLVQKLGGWTKYYGASIAAIVRALWAWEDTNANKWLAAGTGTYVSGTTRSQLAVLNGVQGTNGITTATTLTDITPRLASDDVAVNFSTTSGNSTVTIIDATTTGITSYNSVYISTQVSVGGLILFGLYPVVANAGSTSYTIQAKNVLGSPITAASTVSNGGAVPSFAVTSGASTVTVTLADHNYSVGSTFPVLVSTTVGGIPLYGNYVVQSVPSTSTFTIQAATTAQSITVTGASRVGTAETLTWSSPSQTLLVGSSITVSGISPSSWNGTFTVTSSTPTSVTFTNSGVTGSYSSGGSIDSFSSAMNSGKVRFVYAIGVGPPIASTGYGVGLYGVGGYGTGSPVTATAGNPIASTSWTFDNWGQILISCPSDTTSNSIPFTGIYQWDPTANAPTATVIPQAPPVNDGVFVAMPQRQIIAWGSTFTGIQDPLLIRWCDINNYNSWIASVTNQAGSYRIPKGSRIVGCIQGPQQGLIWTDLALWSMQYINQPYVYSFNEIGTGCGLIAKRAATSMNGVVYWMGQSQFFKLDSGGVSPVFCPVWDVIFQDLDLTNLDKIRIAANSRFGEISWFYPTTGNGGEINAYVKYNVNLGTWDFGTLARSAWINESVLGPPIGADPSSLYIYQHETSPDADGQPLLASFTTGYFALSDADVKTFIDQWWPDMKFGYYGGSQNATINFTFYATDYPGQTPVQYGPYAVTANTTFFSPRIRGRLVQIQVDSSDTGSWWRIGGNRYRLQPDGKF